MQLGKSQVRLEFYSMLCTTVNRLIHLNAKCHVLSVSSMLVRLHMCESMLYHNNKYDVTHCMHVFVYVIHAMRVVCGFSNLTFPIVKLDSVCECISAASCLA